MPRGPNVVNITGKHFREPGPGRIGLAQPGIGQGFEITTFKPAASFEVIIEEQ